MATERSRTVVATTEYSTASFTNANYYMLFPDGSTKLVGATNPPTAAQLLATGASPGWGINVVTPDAKQLNLSWIMSASFTGTVMTFWVATLMWPFTANITAANVPPFAGYGNKLAVAAGDTVTARYSFVPTGYDTGGNGAGSNVIGARFCILMTAATWGATVPFVVSAEML